MQRALSGLVLFLLFASSSVHAALLSRLSGQAYYDTELNITWLADANYAQTSGYDADGLMTWSAAQAWIASLNTANHLGKNDWRLPFIVDTGTAGCNFAYTGTDCGYNVQTKTGATVYSEMAHLYYVTLGNLAYATTGGSSPQPGWGLSNTGPFSNIAHAPPILYWSDSEYAPDTLSAWLFSFSRGSQGQDEKSDGWYAWAVRSGDIAAVPVPGTVWLFGGALAVMGLIR